MENSYRTFETVNEIIFDNLETISDI